MSDYKQPLVSVIIPCYNHENFVQDCIQSVIDQTYQNIELIIIDDGSIDSSIEKIMEMVGACEKRFTSFEFRYRPNKGLSATLNEAIDWCQGVFVSPIASDDMMFSHKTERQVDLLHEQNAIVAVFGAVQLINNDNINIGYIKQEKKIFEFKDLIYKDSFLPAPTQMIRLDVLRDVGGFAEGMIIEDWYIYLKLLETGKKILYIDEFFCAYRTHDSNTFSNPYKMSLGRLQVLNEFSKHEAYKKAFLKVCWDNALETLLLDYKLSIIILFARIFHKLKLITNKFLRYK